MRNAHYYSTSANISDYTVTFTPTVGDNIQQLSNIYFFYLPNIFEAISINWQLSFSRNE